jgi:hypothetical protein
MGKMWEYGILSSEKDEKIIIKNIIEFLEPLNRTMTKAKNKSMLDVRLPYVYKHFYWNLNKEEQIYFEIYPNKDMENKYKFQNNQEAAWILFIRKVELIDLNDDQVSIQENYIRDLLAAIKYDYIKIYEYLEGEERL